MNTKHTPGPWDIWTDREENEIYGRAIGARITAAGDSRSIGSIHGLASNEEAIRDEAAANAKLIAAAPELLAALEALLDQADLGEVDEETQPIVDQARAAIAKATL